MNPRDLELVVTIIYLVAYALLAVFGFALLLGKGVREWYLKSNVKLSKRLFFWWPFPMPEVDERYRKQSHIASRIYGVIFILIGIVFVVLVLKLVFFR